MDKQIGEVVDAWADLNPTQRSNLSERRAQPSAEVLEVMGKLGLRYPPAASVDRDSHAARVALLAEDCADIPAEWLDEAASRWAKESPFMPKACELRESALAIGRHFNRGRILPPPRIVPPPKPDEPPLTDEEISRMSPSMVAMGVKLGEIDAGRAERLRGEAP